MKERYINDLIYVYIFIKKSESNFTIIAIYVNNMNLIEVFKKFQKII